MPVIAIKADKPVALSGFERKEASNLDVLLVDSGFHMAPQAFKNDFQPTRLPDNRVLAGLLTELWPLESLRPFERLRLQRALTEFHEAQIQERCFQEPPGATPADAAIEPAPPEFEKHRHFLEWPLSLQNYFDDRQMALKSLRPLEFLADWMTELSEALLATSLTSSQCREALDLLADLKFAGRSFSECQPPNSDGALWILSLKKLRFPKTLLADTNAATALTKISWPRGVQARWERTGDQGAMILQSKVTTPLEWARLKENLEKLDLGEFLWKT